MAIVGSDGRGSIEAPLTLDKEGNRILITIRDNGPGIPDEILKTLFEPFITKYKTNGTGLGLYLSRELARQHGGDILVESQLQSGSTFTLSLPLALPAPEASEAVRTEPEPAVPHLHIVGADVEAESEPRLA